ncbi:MAG: hypothetical protein JO352_39875 [Chloroflexi bacterium]|nr:hypothetical protein [Chloroflexota bacterium]
MQRTALRVLATALVVAAQLLTTGQAAAQAVSLTTTIWLPGPNSAGLSTLSGTVDQPQSATTAQLSGWVVDTTAQGWSGIDTVQVWNGLMDAGGQQLSTAVLQLNRPDVATSLGNPYYASSGFSANVPSSTFASGNILYIYAHTPDKGWWYQQVLSSGAAAGYMAGPRLDLETPTTLATVHSNQAYTIRGTAYDPLADPSKTTGVDRVQVYLNGDRKTGIYIGDATLGLYDKFSQQAGRGDAGFQLTFQPDSWMSSPIDNQIIQLTVYAHSSVTGSESSVRQSIIISVP